MPVGGRERGHRPSVSARYWRLSFAAISGTIRGYDSRISARLLVGCDRYARRHGVSTANETPPIWYSRVCRPFSGARDQRTAPVVVGEDGALAGPGPRRSTRRWINATDMCRGLGETRPRRDNRNELWTRAIGNETERRRAAVLIRPGADFPP